MRDIVLWSKEKIHSVEAEPVFRRNDTIIYFYGSDESPVDLRNACAEYLCVQCDNIGYDEICERYGTIYSYFEESDAVADMVIKAFAEGREVIFTADDIGASCAAAVIEFFTGGGLSFYSQTLNRKYALNMIVFEKLYCDLCCMKVLCDDIDIDSLRTGRARFDKQQNISRIYDLMHKEYLHLLSEEGDTAFPEDYDLKNEVFGLFSVTKDKVWHLYNGVLFADVLKDFLDKYSKEDIEYFGAMFWNDTNEYGVRFFDTECGDSFTGEHLMGYFLMIKDKYKTIEDDIVD